MIYLDNAATTQVSESVVEAMLPYFTNHFGNPSSLHDYGTYCGGVIKQSKLEILEFLNAKQGDIIFTASASEANNLAILGLKEHLESINKKHIITTKIEHKSVLKAFEKMQEEYGFEITYLDVGQVNTDEVGTISIDDLKNAIREDTGLVSVMYVNNELGSINDIQAIGEIVNKTGILFHTDCVQAMGMSPIDIEKYHIDFLTVSGHKINAPKGIGFLYARNKELLKSIVYGGSQEYGLRAGTENVPYIVAIAKAIKDINDYGNLDKSSVDIIRSSFVSKLLKYDSRSLIQFNSINGKIISLRIDNIAGDTLLLMLNYNGVAVSSGSACNSKSVEPSYVLKAIGLTDDEARSSIRISLSKNMKEAEIEDVSKIICSTIETLYNLNDEVSNG